jgi:hypothetical protein
MSIRNKASAELILNPRKVLIRKTTQDYNDEQVVSSCGSAIGFGGLCPSRYSNAEVGESI